MMDHPLVTVEGARDEDHDDEDEEEEKEEKVCCFPLLPAPSIRTSIIILP